MMKNVVIALLISLMISGLSAAHIEYLNDDAKFKIFNKNNADKIQYIHNQQLTSNQVIPLPFLII